MYCRACVLQGLAVEGSPEPLLQSILTLLITATQDRIPNVRFTAAQVLASLAKQMDDTAVVQQIKYVCTRPVFRGQYRHRVFVADTFG